jgi:hypothetical protein
LVARTAILSSEETAPFQLEQSLRNPGHIKASSTSTRSGDRVRGPLHTREKRCTDIPGTRRKSVNNMPKANMREAVGI